MYKVINESKISFYNDKNEVMYIDYPTDECVWYFSSSDDIYITEESELYELLMDIMSQQYIFSDEEVLKSYKNDNELVWYSDCYYDPCDEWSRNSVSYLKIEFVNNIFKLKCTKPLDDVINRKNKSHVIVFSPLGNGKYTKNIQNGLTLQDDFILMVYQKLLNKEKNKELIK